jgi:hypothetical protein
VSKPTFLAIGGSVVLLQAALIARAQTKEPSPGKNQDQAPVRYEAEAGVPKDKAAEKRRDYAVLEAALNDLASPKNPEYKYRIQNAGPGKEIVVNVKTSVADRITDLILALEGPNRNIDGKDIRTIPAGIREDFQRRSKEPASSLADFKPANPNIILVDLDRMVKESRELLGPILGTIPEKYPTAWGFVWAYLPGYSEDGHSALAAFDTAQGVHGGDWVYMLKKKGKRWEVEWRHHHFYR